MGRLGRLLLGLVMLTTAMAADAENVTLQHGGVTLNANLLRAPGARLEDGVVLMTHGTLAHGGMEIMSTLQALLAERGLNSLSITLGLGVNDRHGMYECATPHRHRHTDALEEIGVWMQWLKSQGVSKVVLLGHSRGGSQTAWFAAERDQPAVNAVVLIAPATWDEQEAAAAYEQRFKKPLQPVLDRARQLVTAGKGDTWLEHTDFMYCEDAKVTAQSFVSYYDKEPRRDSPQVIEKINKPVLVIAGSEDTSVRDVDKRVAPLAESGKITLIVIEGADHFFRDLYAEDVADAIVEFLSMP